MTESANRYFFRKNERLCLHSEINEIIAGGEKISVYPFLANFIIKNDAKQTIKIAISVPKRNFKLAVDRNYVKRRIRETYRLNNDDFKQFCKENNCRLNMILIYVAKEKLQYSQIEHAMVKLLARLHAHIEKSGDISVHNSD